MDTPTPPQQAALESLQDRGFVHQWSFTPSPVPRWRQRQVLEAVLRRGLRFPAHRTVHSSASPGGAKWALYFVYAPDGHLLPGHHFTLIQLRKQGFSICVVIATADPACVPEQLATLADLVIWKALHGYDFSAYKLGLSALARRTPGATVLVMNDSIAGPVTDLNPFVQQARWDLTGFSASGKIENHVQSYAFVLRDLTAARLRAFRWVLFPWFACGNRDDVIQCQETRMARVAARAMTVGALWYSADQDITQSAPFELLEAGAPFIKRSLSLERSAFADKARAARFIHELEA